MIADDSKSFVISISVIDNFSHLVTGRFLELLE